MERDAATDSVGDDAPMRDASPDAPVSAFAYRRTITIANTATSALPAGYTVRVPLGTTLATLVGAGKVQADLDDLRVIGAGALGERNRIVDAAPAPSAISFSLAAPIPAGATSTDYALYYGAPTASGAPADGSAVFTIYDDFSSGISSVWLQNGSPTVAGGNLVLSANNLDALTTNAATDNIPIVSALELMVTVVDPNSDPTVQTEGTFWYWFGYQRQGDFTATDPWSVWIARGKNIIHGEQKSPVGCEAGCGGPDITQNTASHYYVIERDPTASRFYRDGTLSSAISVTNTTDYSLMLRNYMATSDVRIDWVRARARVTPDPSVSLGAEQNL